MMTYSADFRTQVIKSVKQKGMSIRQACAFYDISKATLQHWLKDPTIKRTRNKSPTKIPNEALLQDIKQYPDDYLYERAERFGCSKSGIHNALKRLGISQKKTLVHPRACALKRADYLNKLDDYSSQGFAVVYIDESSFEDEVVRSHGYAPIGVPCIDYYNWQAKKRTNVIGALYEKILFALDYFKSNINGDIFYSWCKDTLIPRLKTKCVVVMDNASFHKHVQRLLNRHGHRLLFLPPYSPELNPIEKKWAQAKFLRQGWMEDDLPKLFYDMGCTDFVMD